MKKLLEKILFTLSRIILRKYQPEIVGITGVVGKTSTKEAVHTVLEAKFGKKVRTNIKNYNNELGVPLTIIGAPAGERNILKWLWVLLKAVGIIIFPAGYPKILVLEMGVDRPGDMEYLIKLAPCRIGVVTAIGEESPVHLEFFKNKDQLIKEKAKILTHLKKEGWALINQDDQALVKASKELKAQKIFYSVSQETDLTAVDIQTLEDFKGLNFKIKYKGNTVPFFIPRVIGLPQVYVTLVATAVGLIYEMNLVAISEAMKSYQAPRGRLNIIPGIKKTVLIDDSYNSAPKSCRVAVNIASHLKVTGRKMACLGDMAELGGKTEIEHQRVGEEIYNLGFDYLFTVGEKARMMAQAALKAGMAEDQVFEFADSKAAGYFIQERLKKGDLLLIKGSQSARMEKITKELMAEPQKAKELLVRQEKDWE